MHDIDERLPLVLEAIGREWRDESEVHRAAKSIVGSWIGRILRCRTSRGGSCRETFSFARETGPPGVRNIELTVLFAVEASASRSAAPPRHRKDGRPSGRLAGSAARSP